MIELEKLKLLIPLINLSEKNLQKLAQTLDPDVYDKGAIIVEQGDTDNDAIYLIEGGVELLSQGTAMSTVIQAGTDEALSPIAHSRPRQFTVKATTEAVIIRFDNATLDRMVVLDELTTSITQLHPLGAKQFEGDSEWLDEMLRNKAFSRLAQAQIAPLVLKMEPVSVKSGEIITRQGEEGNYYFVIKQGKVNVSRKEADGKVTILATLDKGDVFGEESLITGDARNANIVAMGDGIIMKLARQDFDLLLKEPLLSYVDKAGAQEIVRQGGKILDVRTPEEYKQGALKGSVNIPVAQLRAAFDKLDIHLVYVICCRTDIQSEVAAFVMSQNGFDARVLKGGLAALG
jgi:CRP-like cAMP-binding protein